MSINGNKGLISALIRNGQAGVFFCTSEGTPDCAQVNLVHFLEFVMKKFVVALTVMAIAAGATVVATSTSARPPVCNPAVMSC
jgi:hypothetical protein